MNAARVPWVSLLRRRPCAFISSNLAPGTELEVALAEVSVTGEAAIEVPAAEPPTKKLSSPQKSLTEELFEVIVANVSQHYYSMVDKG